MKERKEQRTETGDWKIQEAKGQSVTRKSCIGLCVCVCVCGRVCVRIYIHTKSNAVTKADRVMWQLGGLGLAGQVCGKAAVPLSNLVKRQPLSAALRNA